MRITDRNELKMQTPTTEQAWQLYQSKLLSFIQSRVNSAEDAEDILHDVFASLISSDNNMHRPDNLTAWLYQVTRNRIVDYYRANSKTEMLAEDIADLLPVNQTTDNAGTELFSQLSGCLLPMIKTLPPTYQLPLILAEIEGKKYKQVADELELSLPAVKSRILRGRQMLHKSLLSCCTFYQNKAGHITAFEQKSSNTCNSCDK